MFAVTAASIDPADPLAGLHLGDHPDPQLPPGWERVHVRAAALNHHDLWTLRGVGIEVDRLPIVLGCDAAGVTDDGREVLVHAVIADPDGSDETLSGDFSILSERYDGTFADQVAVPRRNLVPKPASLSFEEAACLPVAWLTAYRMLFTRAGLQPGQRVLVQGAGGGVATAASSAPTRPSPAVSASPARSTPCSRPSARPPGGTRCGRWCPAGWWWSRVRRPARTRLPTSRGSSTGSSASSAPRWVRATNCCGSSPSWTPPDSARSSMTCCRSATRRRPWPASRTAGSSASWCCAPDGAGRPMVEVLRDHGRRSA